MNRGKISVILFLILFITSLFAEFIANDKPIFIYFKDKAYFPNLIMYPETEFGGDFETEADYKDPYVKNLINHDGWMIWPIIKYSYKTINYDLDIPSPAPPSKENILGTDDQARDVFARLIYGFRISILFAILLTISSSFIGIIAGAIQGYYGGKIDLIFQRFIEIWSGLPVLFVLIILANFITPSFWFILFIMLLFSWTGLVGVVRAEFLKARKLEYVKAARVIGVSEFKIIIRHILPNAIVATLTFIPFILSSSLTTLTALDFLGFGLPPGSASLGELLSQGKNNLQAPWLGITGFTVLALTLTLLVFVGEAIRDYFDPHKSL